MAASDGHQEASQEIGTAPVEVGSEVAERVVQMRTVGEIRGYLTHKVKQLWPDVSLLDMTR